MSGHRLTLRFKEDVQPYLQDVTDLLYNFEKLHDLSQVDPIDWTAWQRI